MPRGSEGSTLAAWSLFFTVLVAVGVLVGFIVVGVQVYRTSGNVDSIQRTIPLPPTIVPGTVCTTDTHAAQRRLDAYNVRNEASFYQYSRDVPCHPNNGDEALYAPYYFASFSKGMPHDNLGHVDPAAYALFLNAVNSRSSSAFDAIPQAPGAVRDFTNPQSGLAFALEGGDTASFAQAPAPLFDSAEQAGEMVENYWMWYLRDVPFADYATDTFLQDPARLPQPICFAVLHQAARLVLTFLSFSMEIAPLAAPTLNNV
jgi:hypothetical protein